MHAPGLNSGSYQVFSCWRVQSYENS